MAEPSYISSRLLGKHGFLGLFTLRGGGVSPPPFDSLNFGTGLGDAMAKIESNLEQLSRATGLATRPHQVRQVHGAESHWFAGPGMVHPDEADILLSSQAGTALAVRTADCLPILLADPASGIAAAVHAGWRGTVARVAAIAVREMTNRGANPENILASLGPCIGPCCFEISADVADQLGGCAIGVEVHINRTETTISADLQQINRLQLLQCGMEPGHIERIDACTACDRERFFSYRRDGKESGRHLAVVALPSRP